VTIRPIADGDHDYISFIALDVLKVFHEEGFIHTTGKEIFDIRLRSPEMLKLI
jgi:hypothetical protein